MVVVVEGGEVVEGGGGGVEGGEGERESATERERWRRAKGVGCDEAGRRAGNRET